MSPFLKDLNRYHFPVLSAGVGDADAAGFAGRRCGGVGGGDAAGSRLPLLQRSAESRDDGEGSAIENRQARAQWRRAVALVRRRRPKCARGALPLTLQHTR